jgi:phage gp29-like protein
MILDQYGKPVRKNMLDKEIAAPGLTGVRSLWNFGHVASGLTPSGLAGLLRNAAEGDHNAYLTLAEEMEERDGHYSSVLGTRKRAVSGLPVVIEAATDDPTDVKLADEIRALFSRSTKSMMEHCLDGLGKGFAVVEIIWDRSSTPWRPARYEWRDPRFFQFDMDSRTEIRLRDEADMMNGIPLEPYKFIRHVPQLKSGIPIRGGLARVVAWSWMFKSFDIKDWMAFAEVFGMPLRLGKYRPGEPQANIDILKAAVANLGIDAAAVIPEGMVIEFKELANSAAGADLFERLANWMDSQISKAVLGQTMTADNGSSRSQAEVHNEVRKDLRDADADQLAETLQRDLVIPYIVLNHGPQKAYPKVCLREPESADVTVLSDALAKLVPLGLRVEASEVRDKLGFSDPAKDAECLQPQRADMFAPALNRIEAPDQQTLEDLVRASRSLCRSQGQFTPDQQALEDLVAGIVHEGAAALDLAGQEIDELIRQARSFEELRIMLAEYMDRETGGDLQDSVHRVMVAAELWGRSQAGGEDEA